MLESQTVHELALALPETEEHDHRGHPSFRVRGKIFATLWPQEQRAVLKLAPADQSALVNLDPQTFSPVPGAWGVQGWTNVQLQTAERAILEMALTSAWREVDGYELETGFQPLATVLTLPISQGERALLQAVMRRIRMIIRAAYEADAPAMGLVMVATYLAAHHDQMPAEAWAKRAQEWTPEVSAQGWARTLRAIAAGERLHECIYVAVEEDGELVGLAMGGPANAEELPRTGAVFALYVSRSHQGQGLGRRLLQAVAADLAEHGMTALQIGCLAVNAAARGFYEAMGGHLVSERLFDEEGVMLPEVVYEWADIKALLPAGVFDA